MYLYERRKNLLSTITEDCTFSTLGYVFRSDIYFQEEPYFPLKSGDLAHQRRRKRKVPRLCPSPFKELIDLCLISLSYVKVRSNPSSPRPLPCDSDLADAVRRHSSSGPRCNRLELSHGFAATVKEIVGVNLHNSNEDPIEIFLDGHTYLVPGLSSFVLGDVRHYWMYEPIFRHYDAIIIDPPWENKSVKRSRRYRYLSREDISSLPIGDLISEKGHVYIWLTNHESLQQWVLHELLPHWDLSLVDRYIWLKITNTLQPIIDIDSPHRKPYEMIFVCVKRSAVNCRSHPVAYIDSSHHDRCCTPDEFSTNDEVPVSFDGAANTSQQSQESRDPSPSSSPQCKGLAAPTSSMQMSDVFASDDAQLRTQASPGTKSFSHSQVHTGIHLDVIPHSVSTNNVIISRERQSPCPISIQPMDYKHCSSDSSKNTLGLPRDRCIITSTDAPVHLQYSGANCPAAPDSDFSRSSHGISSFVHNTSTGLLSQNGPGIVNPSGSGACSQCKHSFACSWPSQYKCHPLDSSPLMGDMRDHHWNMTSKEADLKNDLQPFMLTSDYLAVPSLSPAADVSPQCILEMDHSQCSKLITEGNCEQQSPSLIPIGGTGSASNNGHRVSELQEVYNAVVINTATPQLSLNKADPRTFTGQVSPTASADNGETGKCYACNTSAGTLSEDCLSVSTVIVASPSRLHSHKPCLQSLVNRYGSGPVLELFARQLRPGWTSVGNEVLKLQSLAYYERLVI